MQDHYLRMLSPYFRTMTADRKLYLGHRDDHRQAHEKWRSWSWLGDPARLTDTEVQSWMEILTGTDPMVQAEGRSTGVEWMARGLERCAEYWLEKMSWLLIQEHTCRDLSIYGWKVLKPGWREIKSNPIRRPTTQDLVKFDEQVNYALRNGLVSQPPDASLNESPTPEVFGQWQDWQEQNKALYPQTPALPMPSPSDVIDYRGPWIYRPSPFEMRFDPFVEDWQEQDFIFQRSVKPRSWGEKQVEEGKFDEKQFKEASRKGAEDTRLSQWDREIASQIGITWDAADPIYRNSDEYWEVWRRNADAPHLIVLNRAAIVNKNTDHPYWHGKHPYVAVRNVPVERMAIGLGSYHQLRRTFSDRVTFRDLLLDGLVLSVMPVFLKSRNLGMTEMQRFLQPGRILEVNDPNGFKRGWESMAGFAELMKVGEMLLSDENNQLATWDNVAGQAASVGRVSATESSSRLQQALIKHKKKAERIEDEESELWPQMFYLSYQFWPVEDAELGGLRQTLIGDDAQDPLADPRFTRETFGEQIAQNVRFRGATSRLNKELQAQQLKDFLATFAQIMPAAGNIPVPILSPEELRNIAKRAYEIIGQKGAPDVFTLAGDQAIQGALQAHMMQATQAAPMAVQAQVAQLQTTIMQMQMQMQQMMNPQMMAPQQQQLPPGEAPPEEQQQQPPPEMA